MIIVSHHLLHTTKVKFPKDRVVMRINVAWIREKKELIDLLKKIKHDIYLDYPQGRSKPPRPTLTLNEVIELIPLYKNIKHFAISNVEDPKAIAVIKSQLPKSINLIPKIETKKGIETLGKIIDSISAKHIMLDKEDLYIDINRDHKLFEDLIDLARKTCKSKNTTVLELQGVVFAPHK